ncbi:MAG TPA: methyltransferase domain-containing protein [Patescibacteria group bacterium]|nr:methyltransferase domain-containing protein [Patescibacteria group bacterium]
MTTESELDRIYDHRFGDAETRRKDELWKEIANYLQRWVPRDSRVLDVASDVGHFIRNVSAGERWATDVRDVGASLGPGVRFVQSDGLALSTAVPKAYFDVVFVSNYLEHLAGPDAVIAQLREIRAVTKDDGRLIVLQPNIRYVGAAYWDFIDHRVALTERSLVEAATTAGFEVEKLIPRFLPYSTKSRFPQSGRLVRAYLRVPLAWRVLGKQTLLIARPRARAG